MHDIDADLERVHAICAELHAVALVRALHHAVDGAPNWRSEARALLGEIAEGRLREPPRSW